MALSASVKITYSANSSGAETGSTGTNTSQKSAAGATEYTVKRGDTLWAIAKTYLGSGSRYTEIYALNKDIIETTAKNHGKASSDNGHWIWPGTVLKIPGTESDVSETDDKQTDAAGKSDMSSNISDSVSSFEYVDVASGKSDSVSLTLMNIDKEWLKDKMPQKGASIKATIKTTDWGQGKPSFSCGTFILDDISFSGHPLECVLNAVSVPAGIDFKSKQKTVTWQSSTLKDIAQKIASAAGVKLYYSGSSIKVSEREQDKQTDSAFLYELCEKYGFSMKVFNNKIVIFETEAAEKEASVLELTESDLLSWSYNTTIDGTYTGIEFTYTNPDTKDKNNRQIKVTVGKPGRMYYANNQASSKYDAELQAKALLNAANREIETMEITIRALDTLVAGQCIKIKNLGNASGKYYIDQIKHSIGSGYKMQLNLHKVYGGDTKNNNKSGSTGNNDATTDYTVKRGDTLWAIAKTYLGSGSRYTEIYALNKDVIESTAKSHGKTSSDNGHWIWPGTVLKIPGGAE